MKTETKIGIICAVDTELHPFLPHIQNPVITKKAMLAFHSGTIHNIPITAVFCGVGKTNATIATQILIDTYGATTIINSGSAGGMCDTLQLFDTVICTECAHHDVHEGILTGFHPYLTSVFIKSCENLTALSKKAISTLGLTAKTHFGRMVTGETFIEDDGRADINTQFSPLSVDMETASIAHTCYVNSIPYIAIRTITDTAIHSGEDTFEKNLPKASEISKNIVVEILSLLHIY